MSGETGEVNIFSRVSQELTKQPGMMGEVAAMKEPTPDRQKDMARLVVNGMFQRFVFTDPIAFR